MNKQEVIEKIENEIPDFILNDYHRGRETGLTYALELVNQLDEPEKPVVPQFVADWYEKNKDDFEFNIFYYLCVAYYDNPSKLSKDIYQWFADSRNEPIQTLVNMHQFGYTIKKEKLYTAKVKFIDDENYCYLNRNFGVCEPTYSFGQKYNHPNTGGSQTYFDRDELEEILVWNNPAFEIKEVEE